jgi:hypothetical protein
MFGVRQFFFRFDRLFFWLEAGLNVESVNGYGKTILDICSVYTVYNNGFFVCCVKAVERA